MKSLVRNALDLPIHVPHINMHQLTSPLKTLALQYDVIPWKLDAQKWFILLVVVFCKSRLLVMLLLSSGWIM